MVRARAGVYECVYHCGSLGNRKDCLKREGASEAVVQENSPPLQLPLQRFVFFSPGKSGERLKEKKGMIVLLGATGPL